MKQTGLVVLLAVTLAALYLATINGESKQSQFEMWKQRFNAKFDSQLEEQYRRIIFEANLQTIMQHNAD